MMLRLVIQREVRLDGEETETCQECGESQIEGEKEEEKRVLTE